MAKTYGYCRISTTKQKIGRQIDNIKEKYPEAVIIQEAYTGTKIDRPAFSKLCRQLKPGDKVIFDEVSRMSRNAEEGFKTYEELYKKGVILEFIKEPHINTEVYRNAGKQRIEATIKTGSNATDTFTNTVLEAVNQLLMDLAKEQIQLAFEQAQAEVDRLHKRVSEGVQRAIAQGKQVGIEKGRKLTTKKSIEAKEVIKKHSRDFNGTLTDTETMKLAGLARNTYYKYKREIIAEAVQEELTEE